MTWNALTRTWEKRMSLGQARPLQSHSPLTSRDTEPAMLSGAGQWAVTVHSRAELSLHKCSWPGTERCEFLAEPL